MLHCVGCVVASRRPRVYWDSSIFIEYFVADTESAHYQAVTRILDTARKGPLQICTSVISVTEVAWIGRGHSAAFDDDRIDQMWNDPAILLISVDLQLARDARVLKQWAHRLKVTGIEAADALHICTAVATGALEIHTTDTKWFPYSVHAQRPICYPADFPMSETQLPLQ